MGFSRNQILCGTDEPPALPRKFRAGPLSAEFSGGNLRAIRWHGFEVLRGVSYLVRNENWGTYAPHLTNLLLEEHEDRFTVSYDAKCLSDSCAVLTYRARIEGHADGRLAFDASALPDGDFLTNRTGFCILHPIVGVAGSPVEVEHVDGSIEHAHFPVAIDPAQPFFSMRRITHSVAPGVTASCLMEGDAFEMEDQRNWTDASYKTYVRPLALPWPYTLPSGQTIRQTITLTLSGRPERAAADAGGPVSITVGEVIGVAPVIGLVITPEETEATLAESGKLAALSPQHLILHFDPSRGHGLVDLQRFASLLATNPAQVTLELVLPCRDAPEVELRAAAGMVAQAGLHLDALAVCPAPDLKSTPPGSAWPACPPLDEIYRAARKAFPDVPLGGGMFSYFTELNRKRAPVKNLDFITHTTAPIVHAADDRSVMETLEALSFVTASVRKIFGDTPYRIGPSTIGMRHNPYGADVAKNPGAAVRMTMTPDDPRQKGLFAAAWTIGYAAAVAETGLTHLTFGALTGSFGALGEGGYRPVFHAIRVLESCAGASMRKAVSSDPARVLAFAAGDRLLVANLTSAPVEVAAPGIVEVAILDEGSFDAAHESAQLTSSRCTGSLRIGAYGIAIARLGSSG